MSDIAVVTVRCFKPEVDLVKLANLLDEFLRAQGFEVREVMFRIEEDSDETPETERNTAG